VTSQMNPKSTVPDPGPQKNPLVWMRERLAELHALRASPAPRIPSRQKLRSPRPSWLAARWGARLAIRAGIPIEDFLQHRLSRHLAALPVPPSRLPVTIAVEDGGVIASASSPAPRPRAPWLESFLRAEGPAALGAEIQLAQADAARLAGRVEAQRKRLEEVTRELEEAMRGADVADPADEAQAQQMGRPQVPPPLGLGLQLFALALLLAETWQLAVPCLEGAGIRTSDFSAELQRRPMGLVLGSVFALGASASLFLFAHLALRRGLELFQAQPEPRRRLWTALAAAAGALLAAAMAWSIAGVRPGAARAIDLRYARWTLFLIALAIPVATAWMLRTARELSAVRAEALARARAWDHEHYRSYAELSRRAAVRGEEERRLAGLEADRAAAARRLHGLQQRGAIAQRLADDAADQDEHELARVSQSIAAALELDRYEYVRQATNRGSRTEHRARVPAPAGTATPQQVGHGAHEVQPNLGLAG
jgi:hypothetical protein